MIRLVALAAALLLGACAMRVELHFVENEQELAQRCGEDPVGLEPLGCAHGGVMVTPHSNDCEITAFEPRGFDDHRRLETIGHELWHCLRGRTHT